MINLRKEKGQAVIEFAIIIPVLLMIIMFLVTTGMYIFSNMIVVHAANYASRSGADLMSQEDLSMDEIEEQIQENAMTIIENSIPTSSEDEIEVDISDDEISVNVKYQFKLTLPFVNEFFEDDFFLLEHESVYIYGHYKIEE